MFIIVEVCLYPPFFIWYRFWCVSVVFNDRYDILDFMSLLIRFEVKCPTFTSSTLFTKLYSTTTTSGFRLYSLPITLLYRFSTKECWGKNGRTTFYHTITNTVTKTTHKKKGANKGNVWNLFMGVWDVSMWFSSFRDREDALFLYAKIFISPI